MDHQVHLLGLWHNSPCLLILGSTLCTSSLASPAAGLASSTGRQAKTVNAMDLFDKKKKVLLMAQGPYVQGHLLILWQGNKVLQVVILVFCCPAAAEIFWMIILLN